MVFPIQLFPIIVRTNTFDLGYLAIVFQELKNRLYKLMSVFNLSTDVLSKASGMPLIRIPYRSFRVFLNWYGNSFSRFD